jgi:hypothetical protein
MMKILAMLIMACGVAEAQNTGGGSASTGGVASRRGVSDSLFVFQPARPLIDSVGITGNYEDTWGVDVMFSNSGFGAGGFYRHNFTQKLSMSVNLDITGARKSDEFDQAVRNDDPNALYAYDYKVPNKINRLFSLPLTVGLRYRVLDDVLFENLRPYLNAGVGPTVLLALPYQYEFFKSFTYANAYLTAGGYVGIGADFGGKAPSLGFNARYYYIPFARGLESIKGDPITDFGGLFLTMTVGFGQ